MMYLSKNPLDKELQKIEMLDKGYLILDSSSTDFHSLKNKNPMILDAGVVVFICEQGEGKIVVDMHTFHIQKGSFVLLLPYSVIQILEISEDAKVTLVATGFDFLDNLVMALPIENYTQKIQENPCLLLNKSQLQEVRNMYYFLEKRYNSARGPLVKEIQNTLMTYLSLEIITFFVVNQSPEKRKISRQEQVFRNFTTSLAKNFREQRTVEFYASEACLTSKHFSTVIKKKSGKLPSEWIAERTIAFIKFLLLNTDMPIQAITNELNFPNQSFLTRYFKNYTRMTPTEFRTSQGFN